MPCEEAAKTATMTKMGNMWRKNESENNNFENVSERRGKCIITLKGIFGAQKEFESEH